MGLAKPEPTCEEKVCEADEHAKECFEKLIEGGSVQDLSQMLRAFFTPDHAVDPQQLAWQNMLYLFCREPCGPAQGNNAERRCRRVECAGSCNCGCPKYESVPTGCDDPDQCKSFSLGWNYTAIARAAEHAASLTYMPTRIRNPKRGDVLVWSEAAIADNQSCDPCKPKTYGAWVNAPLPPDQVERIQNILDDTIDKEYIASKIQGE